MISFVIPGEVASDVKNSRQRRLIQGCAVAVIAAAFTGGALQAQIHPTPVPPQVKAAPVVPVMTVNDGPAYAVSPLVVRYAHPASGQVPISKIESLKVVLGLEPSGYVTAYNTGAGGQRTLRTDVQIIHAKLGLLARGTVQNFHATAIRSLARQIVAFLNTHGQVGVYVSVYDKDIAKGQDIRPAGDTALHLQIYTAVVTNIRTVASGGRFSGQKNKINNPMAASIAENSPIQPASANKAGSTDLLNPKVLNAYIDQINRQPGTQVAVAVSPDRNSSVPDGVNLDYLVHESKPWHVYFQLSNTGTEQTNPWRETYGLVDNQLLGFNDIFNLQYSTAGFTKQNSINGSYNIPLTRNNRLRMRVYGGYDDFSASDVGFGNAFFNGDESTAGGEGILNVFQHNRLFIDLIAGAKYQHIFVDNTLLGQTGTGDFIIPYVGVHLDHYTPTVQSWADATILGGFTTSSDASLQQLGRLDVNKNWVILQGDSVCQFYLEPLLDPRGYKAGTSTLANQIKISISGQEAFNNRLPAEEEMTAGGLYTVRGYPEYVTAGDSVGIGSVEYLLHIPHLFPVNPNAGSVLGHPFRWVPQEPYGPTDWDLIGKAFLDVGEVVNSNRQSYETDSTLVGTGIGMELDIKHNISLMVDWGVALTRLNASSASPGGTDVAPGSSQINFVFTVSY
jgi:hemolysin activation/secretion protein